MVSMIFQQYLPLDKDLRWAAILFWATAHDLLQPLRDRMDLARYSGNIFLSTNGRIGLGLPARDLFPGFRGYSRTFVETIDITNTSQNYFFSCEIIAQAPFCNLKICPAPVHCDYKQEHTSMNLPKGGAVLLHTCRNILQYRLARLNMRHGIFKLLSKTHLS